MFQSTPLCEGRQVLIQLIYPFIPFQSTPLCEGRPPALSPITSSSRFQSTPLCEGRRRSISFKINFTGFNPRPYARGDYKVGYFVYCDFVSIHAPMRGATPIKEEKNKMKKVSIHAPMRGATIGSACIASLSVRFQSTPLCEGRLCLL